MRTYAPLVSNVSRIGRGHSTTVCPKSLSPIASNLRQLHQALLVCAQENNNHLPSTLEDLLTTGIGSPELLTCPAADDDTPAHGSTSQAQNTAIRTPGNRHFSYLYFGRGLSLPPTTPVLVEPLLNHTSSFNLPAANGEAQFLPPTHPLPSPHHRPPPAHQRSPSAPERGTQNSAG